MKKLSLYVTETCPFCIKVLNFLEESGLSFPLLDINSDEQAFSDLIEYGGHRQVPCLRINDAYLYESNDIIKWVQENISELKEFYHDTGH